MNYKKQQKSISLLENILNKIKNTPNEIIERAIDKISNRKENQ